MVLDQSAKTFCCLWARLEADGPDKTTPYPAEGVIELLLTEKLKGCHPLVLMIPY
jgi:hypothetical protein